jgi:hypothetical protein
LKSRGGRRRPAGAEQLLRQVSDEFKKKKAELGARRAADELGVCLASFYHYVNGETVPDMGVLRDAAEKWHIKWRYLDPSEVLHRSKARSPEQYVLGFLNEMRGEDIEVVGVKSDAHAGLRVVLKIRFPI